LYVLFPDSTLLDRTPKLLVYRGGVFDLCAFLALNKES
jgi:hypothetical protein